MAKLSSGINRRTCGGHIHQRARVVHLRVQREVDVSNLGDLLLYSLDDLEAIAADKGGIHQLLDEKWRQVYRANASRGLFTCGDSSRAHVA